jgi:effector-binding domain-containing protein
MMLKIGDFSRLSQISVDTLRYYDTLGLLKPSEVDPHTGYRYYAFHQLGRLNRILALKDLGLTLEQIAAMLEGDISAEQLKGMLKLKQAEIAKHIEDEHDRLTRVETRLMQIERENNVPSIEVVVKHVQPQLVASIRRVMPSYDSVLPLYDEIMDYLAQHEMTHGRPIAIWRDDGYRDQAVDTEVVVTLNASVPKTDTINVYELPGGDMASIVHNGAYKRLYEAYAALSAWIEANGYRITGPAREHYHYGENPLSWDDESCVTEVQFPVEKI